MKSNVDPRLHRFANRSVPIAALDRTVPAACVDEICPVCDARGLRVAREDKNPYGTVTFICRLCGRTVEW
jgi:hypothetical protein